MELFDAATPLGNSMVLLMMPAKVRHPGIANRAEEMNQRHEQDYRFVPSASHDILFRILPSSVIMI